MKLSYSREAISDLIRLREFIASKNPEAAHKISKSIRKEIAQLKTFPYLVDTNQWGHIWTRKIKQALPDFLLRL